MSFIQFILIIEQTLIVPDYMDRDVEDFCLNNGIKCKKYNTKDLLNPNKIITRVEKVPKGYTKAYIDARRLEELITFMPHCNVNSCKHTYENDYKDEIDTIIKSGNKFSASTLTIKPDMSNWYKGTPIDYPTEKLISAIINL